MSHSPSKYRPEIDGLRAIAVLIVLLGHLGIEYFHGGFVGVDVFFVISGFLITGIIYNEIQGDSFSLLNFYERRIRRIIPAFYFLIFPVSIVVLITSLPTEAESFFKSLLAATLYGSNYYFLETTHYFAAAAHTKPLLHTWSLGVEEQFYFIFPLFLLMLWKKLKKYFKGILLAVFFVSLAFYSWQVVENPEIAFYILPTRFWELLLGAFLALNHFEFNKNKTLSELLGLVGMILIFYPVITMGAGKMNPGPYALAPTVGAALLILSNLQRTNIVGKLLGLKPLVFIGKISYSLYLWHWSLLVFYLEFKDGSLSLKEKIIIIILSHLLAYLSWKFVEQPFRKKALLPERKALFKGFIFSSVIIVFFSSIVIYRNGFPERFGADLLQLRKVSRLKNPLETKCFSKNESELDRKIEFLSKKGFCNKSSSKNKSVLLWGDSQAAASISMVESWAKKAGMDIWVEAVSGCPPLVGVSKAHGDKKRKCSRFNDLIIKKIKEQKPERIVLVARWSTYFTGRKHPEGPLEFLLKNEKERANNGIENQKLFKEAYQKTLSKLRELDVETTIVLQAPEYNVHIPKKLLKKIKNRGWDPQKDENSSKIYGKRKKENEDYFQSVNKALVTKEGSESFLNLSDYFCPVEECLILKDGKSLYRDGNHISNEAAFWLGRVIEIE